MTDQTQNHVPDGVFSKIQAMLNLADKSRNNSQAEAELAMEKAQALLFKYNLTLADIRERTDSQPTNNIDKKDTGNLGTKAHEGKWRQSLIFTIARFNFCRAVIHRTQRDQDIYASIIGTKENAEVVTELYSWVSEQLERFASESWKEYNGSTKKNTFRRSFFEGAVNVIHSRLQSNWAKLQQESVSSTALVVSNDKALEEAMDSLFGKLGKSRPSHSSALDAHLMGRKAGHNTDLNRPNRRLQG